MWSDGTPTLERSRQYTSPLRERQARETRHLILTALTDLLETNRADEITTREIATAAGVSERTVYRHFPDRHALLLGLAGRLKDLMLEHSEEPLVDTIDDLGPAAVQLMSALDRHHPEARAEALFNADPHRFTDGTREGSERMRAVVAAGLPDLSAQDVTKLVAVIRCLLSAQAWLRMREEFGVPGEESGRVVAWVLGMIVDEVRRGGSPGSTTTRSVDR